MDLRMDMRMDLRMYLSRDLRSRAYGDRAIQSADDDLLGPENCEENGVKQMMGTEKGREK